jgi:hypothetical protein
MYDNKRVSPSSFANRKKELEVKIILKKNKNSILIRIEMNGINILKNLNIIKSILLNKIKF